MCHATAAPGDVPGEPSRAMNGTRRTGRGREPSHEMSATEVTGVLEALESAGVAVWVDGGWGVDALCDEQLRPHDDLDIVVAIEDAPIVKTVLRDAGYTHQESDVPLSFMVVDPAGRQVDVHPVAFDDDGNGLYQMPGGEMWTYSADGLAGTGSIGGRPVRCLTPQLQMRAHAGYELTERDREEIRLLYERFGVDPPPGDARSGP
jgi:lincosamide nucleotidyltransferase A/C/D/E